ncbi:MULTISPECIES: hypothetical protein [Archangium]|uniref:Uncharacterized protein n=1 Tax=Archangium violaceum Cb vi76 TaxID=1406225 RepID=A0A084SPI8_9BACT|nr:MULTISPECIES: hypothetical protein [Archangium]KFA90373.1 hypothetical protein Q664_29075 [Archangium violaceum Cb vi76]OJT20712.1 hypothetical protein BO221_32070 [Archangium sp. Cb G35]
MLSIHEHATLEEASTELLEFALEPSNWTTLPPAEQAAASVSQDVRYQRRVGPLRIYTVLEVAPSLEVFLRVAFRAPGLTPVKAADHLEAFLKQRLPLTPNSEWQVEVDERRWIHFVRRYAAPRLQA